MARGLFVTGTDTGVGKTVVACALIRGFAAQGYRVVGMKPVAAGDIIDTPDGRMNEDVARLRAAGNVDAPLAEINPYCFDAPIAPHIAAAREGRSIDLDVIVQRYTALAARADVVVVEGAGGFLVPLNERQDFSDLARRLALPVVLVVGMRLGCLNHALLTQAAIRACGLTFEGWVANRIDPEMAVATENVDSLRRLIKAQFLGETPHSLSCAEDGYPQAAPILFEFADVALGKGPLRGRTRQGKP
jgi:dethiobiotin synthetase